LHINTPSNRTADSSTSSTILLVEDEPVILKVTKARLEKLGYTVFAASTAGESSTRNLVDRFRTARAAVWLGYSRAAVSTKARGDWPWDREPCLQRMGRIFESAHSS
jgi:hypothetical protein